MDLELPAIPATNIRVSATASSSDTMAGQEARTPSSPAGRAQCVRHPYGRHELQSFRRYSVTDQERPDKSGGGELGSCGSESESPMGSSSDSESEVPLSIGGKIANSLNLADFPL